MKTINLGLLIIALTGHIACAMQPQQPPFNLLLEKAVINNNVETVEYLLSENKANANQINGRNEPTFFKISNVVIAEKFVKHNVNLQMQVELGFPNVLWKCLYQQYPLKLVAFYLARGVDATKKDPIFGDCIFHDLVNIRYQRVEDINYHLQLGALLFKKAPEMINAFNDGGKTPLDTAQELMKEIEERNLSNTVKENSIVLIEFLKKNGAKTAHEIETEHC